MLNLTMLLVVTLDSGAPMYIPVKHDGKESSIRRKSGGTIQPFQEVLGLFVELPFTSPMREAPYQWVRMVELTDANGEPLKQWDLHNAIEADRANRHEGHRSTTQGALNGYQRYCIDCSEGFDL